MKRNEVAVIVGAGPGLGCALARRFARAEMHVALAARHGNRLDGFAAECSGIHHHARTFGCDATDEPAVDDLFRQIEIEFGIPDLVVYNAGAFLQKGVLETTRNEFEHCWRVGCLGGFLVGRAALRAMLGRPESSPHRGTVIFTGATASLRGSARFHNLAVGKFGLRALAQSMAREFQARGIHVAHVVIDGRIRDGAGAAGSSEEFLDPDAIAETYYQLHRQPRSAWSLEVDLRPWVERF